ncbi:cytochrome P450 3A24 isoform X2 [Parasteatoda tepidariorum]|uniref:cytochrome P450 3A24 isoform X2 n=1 Tax=Parasteatoda tepidariorum TaxID=114398 RepID=UPI0039BD930E
MFSITSRTFEDIQSSITQIKTGHTVPIQILLLTSTLALFIWYNYRIRNYWKSKGIVQVKPQSIFGAFLDIVKKPVHELEIQRYKKYGSLYGYFEGSLPVLSVGDPQLIRKIIVKDFNYFTDTWTFDTGDEIAESTIQMLHGEEWKKVRSIIAPNFSTLKMSEKVKYCADECVKNFDAFAKIGQPVDVKKFYNAFTMDVITNTAFSLKTDSQRNPSNAFVKNATDLFEKGINWRYILYLLFPQLFKLLKVSVYEPKATEFFVNVTNEVVRERRRSSLKSDDFLQFMMDNTDEQNNKREARRKSLSEQELVSQCVFSFLAGFETTAITLCFITYFLALYPDIQEKLIEEVDAIMTSHNGNITYEVIQEMQYMDQVISETIRLCPPTVRLDRVSVKDYQIEDTGIVIPKGTIILIPIIAIQRDEKYYPDPEKFDPDRFSPEEKSKIDPFTYLPFGAGPRQCIGIKLALLEAKICLAYVLSHFRVKRCSQTKEPLEYNNGVGFLHPKEVFVNLEKREDCPLSLHLQK